MALHAPSLHFHLGAWAVTALCTFLAFWINFMRKRNMLPDFIDKRIHPDIVARLEYVAHVTGVIGFLGVIGSSYFGFLDASKVVHPSPLDFNIFLLGLDKALSNEILSFKVQWTFVGVQAFLFAGILRFYFVTLKRKSSVYDQHYVVQILYAEATLIGFFLMVIVAGAGGIWVYGESILTGIPVLEDFLPGGNLLVPIVVFTGIFTILFIVSAFFAEKVEEFTTDKVLDVK